MASIPVYTGQWVDWSHGSVLGNYRTFTQRDTLYIVGATGAYLTIVGGGVWSMWAFYRHQRLSSHRNPDIVDLQHRNTYRNASTAIAAMTDAFWIYWWWKPWTLCGSRRASGRKSWVKYMFPCQAREKRAQDIGRRTCLRLILPALLIFAIFVVAGIFGSFIARPAYRSNTVLVQGEDGACGITLFDTTIDVNNYFDIDASNRTRTAVSYARTCYSPASGVIDSITCSLFAVPRLNYSTAEVGCPFGDPKTPFDQSICAVNSNQGAFALQTERLNSHDHFGINAKKRERVELYKEMVCSPLSQNGFNTTEPSAGAEKTQNQTTTYYTYGALPGLTDYTYAYNSASVRDNVPFAVTAVMHNATGPGPWAPVSNLSRSDADVFIVFIAPNSILYRNQVKDPVFQATYPNTELTSINNRFTVYNPDYLVSVVACTEQYSICNPRFKDRCTPLDSQTALLDSINHLDLSLAQYVTAIRMIYMIADGNTYSSVDGIGPDALQLWSQVHDFVVPTVPDNQWQLEVRGWLDTTLAKWQAYMVNYAHNTAALGPHGHIGFPISNDTLDQHWQHQCQNQKISNIGLYQNVSVFGFSLIWAVGGVLVVLSLSLRHLVTAWQKFVVRRTYDEDFKARRRAWNIDGRHQQQRIAWQTAGYYELVGGEDDVPYLERMADLPLPFHAVEERHRGGTFEVNTGWARRPAGAEDEEEDSRVVSVARLPEKEMAGHNIITTAAAARAEHTPDSRAVPPTAPHVMTSSTHHHDNNRDQSLEQRKQQRSRVSSVSSSSSSVSSSVTDSSPLNTFHQQTTTTNAASATATASRESTRRQQQQQPSEQIAGSNHDDDDGDNRSGTIELPLWLIRAQT